jgi:hypothetical protein
LPPAAAQHEKFNKTKHISKLANSAASAGADLDPQQRKDLVALFYEVDVDRSGWLNETEAFSALPVELCPHGSSEYSIEWDPQDDDRITLVEWCAALPPALPCLALPPLTHACIII